MLRVEWLRVVVDWVGERGGGTDKVLAVVVVLLDLEVVVGEDLWY